MSPYILGVPSYANTAPLYHFLEEDQGLRFRYGVPTELNRWLLSGEVDLSLVSSYFYLQNAHQLRPLPDFSVADLGPVYSVNLFHRKPWNQLSSVALTTESATSIRLLQYLLQRDAVQPDYHQAQGGLELLEQHDAVLLIGDRAITSYTKLLTRLPPSVHQVPWQFRYGATQQPLWVTDLSLAWFRATRLPFVFGVWATRIDQPPPAWAVQRLRTARSLGLGSLATVAEAQAQRLDVPSPLMQHYLWNFRYHLELPDRLGLQTFAEAIGLPYPDDYWEV